MKLILAPDPWLKKKVTTFDFNEHNAIEIEQQMIDLMLLKNGIGLSANQVGLDAQVFVIKPHLLDDKKPFAIFNPVITQVTVNMLTETEGCLSHPGLYLDIKRPRGLIINYLDTYGKECILELYDIDARCFLHEYDHLQGIEFIDRVSKLKYNIAKRKLEKNKRNKNGRTV